MNKKTQISLENVFERERSKNEIAEDSNKQNVKCKLYLK